MQDSDSLKSGLGPRLVVNDDPAPPPVFVRAVVTVPAMPWDQARAARLEATLNAPLPLTELALALKRLDRWKPRTPGRFAAVYARHADIGDGLSVAPELDGRPVEVHFPSATRRRAQVRLMAIVTGAATAAVFLLFSVGANIWTSRTEAEQRLESLEQQADRRLKDARAAAALSAQARALDAMDLEGRRAAVVLKDIAWAARARRADANIEAFHWEGGLFAVEARGEASPFVQSDQPVRRSQRPVRAGVWLWSPDTGAGSATAP